MAGAEKTSDRPAVAQKTSDRPAVAQKTSDRPAVAQKTSDRPAVAQKATAGPAGRRARVAPPTRPALRERYERKRREVIATAARLFARHGYQETSMSDLTEATGLAAGGLYHYIESKDELLISICDELLDPLLERAGEILAAGDPPDRELRRLLHAWLAHIASHRDHMLVFAQERHVIEREPQWRRVRAQRKRFEKLLDDVLARGEREGAWHFEDRAFTLLTLLGMVNYTPQWLNPRGRLTPEQIADGYCDLILRAAT